MNLDKYLLQLAYEEAVKSPDPSNQNGAVLVRNGQPVARDCNRFPYGFHYTREQLEDRDWKIAHIEHAERNVLFMSARWGGITLGTTMVVPWFACVECARAIIQAGVTEVVGHRQRMDTTPDRWKASIETALQYLRDCDIKLRFYDGPVGGPPIRVNGEMWVP